MKDKTYMALLQYGAQKDKTLGKLINEILNDFVKQISVAGQTRQQAIGIMYDRKATLKVLGRGQQKFFVCADHKGLACQTGSFQGNIELISGR